MPPVCLLGADRCSSWDGPGTSGSALNRDDQPEQLQPGQRRGDVPGGESDLLGDPTLSQPGTWRDRVQHPAVGGARSEEHTSELQSRGHLVCRLLLEKTNSNYN